MANTAVYKQTYNSFSGVDMLVSCAGKVIGELQGISYTVTREKAPLYTMGSADPRSFSRGKRGIAGSLVFLVFDRSALLETLGPNSRYLANDYELTSYQRAQGVVPVSDPNINQSDLRTFNVGTATGGDAQPGTIGLDNVNLATNGDATFSIDKSAAAPLYHDQIPPFDIVITAANEYGHHANMAIHQVEIMNCGSGLSIDDITTDEACTFVATSITPWNGQGWIDPKNPATRITTQASSQLPGARHAAP